MAGDFKITKEQTPRPVRLFTCPGCGAQVHLRAAGQSVTAVCGSCAAVIDSTNENFRVIERAAKQGRRSQVIPLGRRGKLHGWEWEVIGYMEREDLASSFTWSEYLLFNPAKGFRWLTESDGHWNYVITTKAMPKTMFAGRRKTKYLGKEYYLFHSGKAQVIFVTGEFYWRVRQGDTASVEDYIAPPEVLSREGNDGEVIWSLGTYTPADIVKAAFKITDAMPIQLGVAPNEPSLATHSIGWVGRYWLFFASILVALQFLFMLSAQNQTVYTGQFGQNPLDVEKTKVTPQFELSENMANLEIGLSAGVQNNWLEIQGDLVNDDTGETTELELGVEYYYGSDSDGSWSEGSQFGTTILSTVPKGKYHLNLESANGQLANMPYQISVRRDVVTWSNFLWAIGLISIYPIFVWWRGRTFEMNRWSQSDHSPYPQHQGDE